MIFSRSIRTEENDEDEAPGEVRKEIGPYNIAPIFCWLLVAALSLLSEEKGR